VSTRIVSGAPTRVGAGPDRSVPTPGRPIGTWTLSGVALTAIGGPLALGALYGPAIVEDVGASAGLISVAAVVAFGVPLLIWLRYAKHINSAGGLYSFVEAAAGRPVALVQAGVWVVSYVLYLLSTTGQIVHDTLPDVWSGVGPWQSFLEVAIPLGLAAVMIAGRTATLASTSLLAAGQLVLLGIVDVMSVGHAAPATSFVLQDGAAPVATAAARTSLLYVCASLPLFLGGEVRRPQRAMPRALVGAWLVTAVGVGAAVFPLAHDPAFAHADIPGMSVVRQFGSAGLGTTIGIGVAVSIGGVMLVEYLALTRLLHAVTGRSARTWTFALAGLLAVVAPLSLIDPDAFYDNLLRPSLFALWASQLIVFAVYPRFARKVGDRVVPASVLAALGCAFAVYGGYVVWSHTGS